MAYNEFAYWYDELNSEANYKSLIIKIKDILIKSNLNGKIIADLGCGTGEISLGLEEAGYDMISVDSSPDMLSVFREKITLTNKPTSILLLCQKLENLNLYGTINAAVSTFDTLNHLTKENLEEALLKLSLFMEENGVFIFDANSPYKHSEILANNSFIIELEDNIICTWKNKYDEIKKQVNVCICLKQDNKILFEENFIEYTYTFDDWRKMLEDVGFTSITVIDGETFEKLEEKSQRFLFKAIKSNGVMNREMD